MKTLFDDILMSTGSSNIEHSPDEDCDNFTSRKDEEYSTKAFTNH